VRDDGFRDFVDARWQPLVRFAWTLVGDRGHAEDLVQVALERTWRRWRQIRGDDAEPYVRAAIVNLAISRSRRRRFRESSLDELMGGGRTPAGPMDPAESSVVRQAVWVELQQLPPRMRAVIVLRFLEDLSEAQTAALLGCSAGTVKSQTSRAMARLRERAVLRDLVGAAETEGDLR
jgi:RNA polymerase sigma-70 factor (sigma-E family)